MSLADRVAEVRERMAQAAARSGRPASAVQLVAVSKYVDAAVARQLVAAGCMDLGEARPQELWHKAGALADLHVRWHLVGHLQTNKVRRTVPLVELIHSVDNARLLDAINEVAMVNRPARVLMEVNTSGDTAKHGLQPMEVEPLLAQIDRWPRVRVCGLMTMAALEGGPDIARRNFADLRNLRDSLQPQMPSGVALDELSMGMSDDYEIAIEEGATLVRVGSVLFE
jgi:pyridoxal phosphate enzyme (YggS family)